MFNPNAAERAALHIAAELALYKALEACKAAHCLGKAGDYRAQDATYHVRKAMHTLAEGGD